MSAPGRCDVTSKGHGRLRLTSMGTTIGFVAAERHHFGVRTSEVETLIVDTATHFSAKRQTGVFTSSLAHRRRLRLGSPPNAYQA